MEKLYNTVYYLCYKSNLLDFKNALKSKGFKFKWNHLNRFSKKHNLNHCYINFNNLSYEIITENQSEKLRKNENIEYKTIRGDQAVIDELNIIYLNSDQIILKKKLDKLLNE